MLHVISTTRSLLFFFDIIKTKKAFLLSIPDDTNRHRFIAILGPILRSLISLSEMPSYIHFTYEFFLSFTTVFRVYYSEILTRNTYIHAHIQGSKNINISTAVVANVSEVGVSARATCPKERLIFPQAFFTPLYMYIYMVC